MANWWEAAPLDDSETQHGKWWDAAPLARPRVFERDEDEALYWKFLNEKSHVDGPQVPRAGGDDDRLSPEELAIQRVQEQRAKEAEEADFQSRRSPLKRATDTSTFLLSAPIRAVTRGQYGLGDVAGVGSDAARSIYSEAERDFVRANADWLEPAAKAGEAAIGIPVLQSMGAVPRQLLRTTSAALKPAAIKTAPRQTVNALRKYAGLPPTTAPARTLPPAPAPAPAPTAAQTYGPAQRIADRAAFQAENIPEFAPAFTSKGTARLARTIEETPVVGGTVSTPKLAVEQAMAQRQAQLARQAGPELGQEGVGDVVQHGLRRFRTSGLEDLERSRVQGLGITPDRAAQNVAGNVNINRPSRLNTAQMTERELTAAAQSRVDLPGAMRSRMEDLSPREVQRIIDLPARDTSFAVKAAALYRQAEDALPQAMRVNETANPGLLATRNAANVARGLMRQEQAASISGGVLEGRFGALVQRLANPRSNFTLDGLRAARTEIGRALSNFGEFDVRLDRGQLKQLYGAVSDDIQSGLVALAARARRLSRLQPGDEGHVAGMTPQVADAADQALQRYRVADRYFRQGIDRMDRFMNVLGADTLEQASRRIGQYLRENTQNIRALESMASSLRPEEWRAVLGNVIDGLGRLPPGAREAERLFSFERFATDWNKISRNQRVVGLLRRSLGDETVQSLENLGRVAERMKFYETTKNFSGSAYTAFGGATLATLYNPVAWPFLIGSIAGTGLTGKILTSRVFASWVNSLNHAQVQVGSSLAATKQALRPHVHRLLSLATTEPDPQVAKAMTALGYVLSRQLQASDQQSAKE